MDFVNGFWAGSLVDPHLSGDMKATQLGVELAAISATNTTQTQVIHLDSVEAFGRYSAARIDLAHGQLRSGKAAIDFSGSLTAASLPATHGGIAPIPSFDANSVLHLRLTAGKVGLDDLRPFTGPKLPAAGSLDAQLQLDGPIHSLGGSGWVEMDKGSVFSEPVDRIRAQGTLANQTINLTSVSVSQEAGKITASGSYNLSSHFFRLDASGAGIEVARIDALRRMGLAVTGKLGFTVKGEGTPEDPRLEVHATLPGLTLSGESLGNLELAAHTANRAVTYDLTTRLEAADFSAHGQTALTGDYDTHAKVEFSRLNIGVLFKLAHVEGISGESALAGTVTIEGPLARPDEMRGEARLQQLAVTVAGVHSAKRRRPPRHARPCPHPSRSVARDRRRDRPARPGQPVAQGQATIGLCCQRRDQSESWPRPSIPT